MKTRLDAQYWEQRYRDQDTPWDMGHESPPLRHYTQSVTDRSTRILIPGAGYAHEAVALHQRGFRSVYVCDWAPSAFEPLKEAAPDFPEDHLLVGDFFELDVSVDLMLEQTFFCALSPDLRPAYVEQAARLLAPDGRLAGVLFSKVFERSGPPFGGSREEYESLFSSRFEILRIEAASDSIAPRLGSELFIELQVI